MAPRGRRKKAGLTREDAARDAMRAFGFEERLITVCIKELLEVYGVEGWFLIEDCAYMVLLNKCIEKSAEQGQNLADDMIEERAGEQNDEMVEAEQEENDNEMVVAGQEQNHEMVVAQQEQNNEIVEAEQEQTLQQAEENKQEQEQEKQVEDGRDHVGSNSTSLVGCVAETGAQTCHTEALSITSQTDILDSSPAGEASVIDYASPVAFPSADASGGFAQHSAEGAKSSGCGWLSEDDDSDIDADSVGDDDEMIQLTPEPLCEELEELISEIRGEKTRKKTKWDN